MNQREQQSTVDPQTDGQDQFFDTSFVAELEALASAHAARREPIAVSETIEEGLERFLKVDESGGRIEEVAFAALDTAEVLERANRLLESCREVGPTESARAVESFIVFFQALVPTLAPEACREIKRFFFRMAPTLLHITHNDFSDSEARRREGQLALRSLETVLIEIASVKLTPNETDLVFRSIDEMAAFIAVGEYALASELISAQLLSIIQRNRLMRSLFRLMEVEVRVQRYLKERLNYLTPRIRIPDDFEALSDYGPLRILREQASNDGDAERWLLQIQMPDIPILRDVVVHLEADGGAIVSLRMDALGTAPLDMPPGTYSIGLVYEPA